MKFRLWLTVGIVILTGLSSDAAEIYRWTDANGILHFGNRPPADARDLQTVFKEIPSETSTGPQAADDQEQTAEAMIQEFEAERRREEEQARKASADTRRPLPTRTEMIAREKDRLEKKISQLEQAPLEQFGSQRNKRAQIGFYEYRLQALLNDPEGYFKNPVQFEGNVPTPDKKASD
jgi:hypothetical protein